MDVEDLIASMHVGREGYELKALQAHLSKTLNYNPETTTYQPVQGVHYIPPPPVSSLNSMASTSYGTSYHQYPTHPNLSNNQGRAVRPQCTPAHSYRGFQPSNGMTEEGGQEGQAMDTDMDDVSQTDHAPNRTNNNNGFTYDFHRRLPSPPNEYDEGDFAAFSSDAFAPVYANNMGSQKSDDGKPSDGWSAFKTKPRDRKDDPGVAHDGAYRGFSTSPSWTLNGAGEQAIRDGRFGLPTPPEEEPAELKGNWSGGRLRNTSAREHRRLHGDAQSRRK